MKHLLQDKSTGRVSYRRAVPAHLRSIVGKREIKHTLSVRVPPGTKALPPDVLQAYSKVDAEAERTLRVAAARAAGKFASLDAATIAALVAADAHHQLAGDDDGRVDAGDEDALFLETARDLEARLGILPQSDGGPQRRFEKRQDSLETYLALLRGAYGPGDWSMMAEDALDLCKANGLAVDPQSADFRRLALAMLAGRIDATEKALQRQSGHLVTTPPLPSVTPSGGLPDSPKTIRDAVREYTASEGASPATALAYGTAANYFVSLHGDLAIGSVTKPQAAAFKAALQSAPARLSQQDRARPLRDVIAAYADRPDVPRIHARTVNQHVSALERVWDWAVAHGHARGDKNPFAGLRIKRAERAPAASAKPKEYSIGDLTRLFATPVFAAGERPSRGRGEAAYWLPLVALFTAARREEVAMLMVRDVARDADSGRWMLTIGDPTPHPTKGARRTKTGAQRTFPLPLALIRLGFLDHVEGMRAAGEQRLFPSLTITNARRQLGAKWGEWWSEYVKAAGISVSEPMHGFRHAWSTAARASGVPKDAREWIMGHAGDGRTNDQYGNRAALAHHMDAVRFAGLDLSHLERPGTEDRAAAYAW